MGRRTTARLGVETLEGRDMPAVTVDLAGGVLTVRGSDQGEVIKVVQEAGPAGQPGVLRVFEGGTLSAGGTERYQVSDAGVGAVRLDGLGGNDYLVVAKPGDPAGGFNRALRYTVNGGAGDDTIIGSWDADVLSGDAGNDSLNGNTGNDTLVGGTENDTLHGNLGDDTLVGGDGADVLHDVTGADVFYSGAGADQLVTSGTDDRVVRDPADAVYNQPAAPVEVVDGVLTYRGTDGGDYLAIVHDPGAPGRAGTVRIDGGAPIRVNGVSYSVIPDDAVRRIVIHGMDGNDLIRVYRPAAATPTTAAGFNRTLTADAFGGLGNDVMEGGAGDDRFSGGAGEDTLRGAGGDDTLHAGTGNDVLDGGAGRDTLTGGGGVDRVVGREPADAVTLSPISEKWAALTAAGWSLGNPTSDELDAPAGGLMATFENGYAIYWSPATGAFVTHGAIRAKYEAEAGLLGLPTSDLAPVGDGVGYKQEFGNNGDVHTVLWSPATGAVRLHGALRAYYLGRANPAAEFGYPTGEERLASDGVTWYQPFERAVLAVSPGQRVDRMMGAVGQKYLGLVAAGTDRWFGGFQGSGTAHGGEWAWFDHGVIFRHADGRVVETHGAVFHAWANTGGVLSPHGMPVSDHLQTPDGRGWYTHFANGASVYWTPQTGAQLVSGPVRAKWAEWGWERGQLGFPTGPERDVPGGRAQFFENGFVYRNPDTGGVHVGTWRVAEKYRQMVENGTAGWLGALTADVQFHGPTAGTYLRFHSGLIFQHGLLPAAYETHGAVYSKWLETGGLDGWLGYPKSDHLPTRDHTGWFTNFENGSVYWSPATGAHTVGGAIYATWAGMGFEHGNEHGRLGFPVTDELPTATGRVSYFEFGSLWFEWATGRTTVRWGRTLEARDAVLNNLPDGTVRYHAGILTRDDGVLSRADLRRLIRDKVALDRTYTAAEFESLRYLADHAELLPLTAEAADLLRRFTARHWAGWEVGGKGEEVFGGAARPAFRTHNPDPAAAVGWQRAEGNLFGPPGDEVRYGDVRQGGLGDCYFMTILAGLALRRPAEVRQMITDNGDDTFTVRFFEAGRPVYIVVDRELPVTAAGAFAYARPAEQTGIEEPNRDHMRLRRGEGPPVLWAALIEKAYAIYKGRADVSAGSYQEVHQQHLLGQPLRGPVEGGGMTFLSYADVTGRDIQYKVLYGAYGLWTVGSGGGTTQVVGTEAAWRTRLVRVGENFRYQNGLVFVSTTSTPRAGLRPAHVYTVLDYDPAAQRFTLYNPHGPGPNAVVLMTVDEMVGNFHAAEVGF